MRAVYYEANGAAHDVLRLGTVDDPVPGPGEVRVRVVTSGVNPTDVKSRAGLTRRIAFARVIPHHDGAGVIDRVGDGVPASRVGERVWVLNAQWRRPFGTCADYVTLPADQAVTLPDHVGFDVGACLGVPAMTACLAVAAAPIEPNATVLVSGGAGAVGGYAIQFARARGARVLATVSSDAKAALARSAGADLVIDYRREDVAAVVASVTQGGVDVVVEVDIAANAPLLPRVIRPLGTVVAYGTGVDVAPLPLRHFVHNAIWLKFVNVFQATPSARQAALATIVAMLAEGRLVHNVGPSFPLERTADAHEAVESGAVTGKVLVRIGQ